MAARQFLKIWNETTFGTFAAPGSPAKNTDYVVVELSEDNAFQMRPKPVQVPIRTASNRNRRTFMVGAQAKVEGQLQTLLYPEQASFLLAWGLTLASNDLNSCTVDHAIVQDDSSNTISYRRYLGVKVSQLQCAASQDDPLFKLSLDLVAQKPASPNITITDFPEPAYSEYPATIPYVFPNFSSPGILSLGSTRTEFSNWTFTSKNMLDTPLNESQYISRSKWCGRDIDTVQTLVLKAQTDRVTTYEGSTAVTASYRIDNGTRHIILDFKTNSYYTDVTDALSLDKIHYQALSLASFYDGSSSTDLTLTVT